MSFISTLNKRQCLKLTCVSGQIIFFINNNKNLPKNCHWPIWPQKKVKLGRNYLKSRLVKSSWWTLHVLRSFTAGVQKWPLFNCLYFLLSHYITELSSHLLNYGLGLYTHYWQNDHVFRFNISSTISKIHIKWMSVIIMEKCRS